MNNACAVQALLYKNSWIASKEAQVCGSQFDNYLVPTEFNILKQWSVFITIERR